MHLKEICALQSDFDARHRSKLWWNAPITKDNIQVLEHLIVCLLGELGECSNMVKKVVRGDVTYDDIRSDLAAEIADTFIYLIKICNQASIDLEQEFLRRLEYNKTRFKKYEVL